MSMTSMAPDIYPVDIARIEALSGPQSTLFGASSQTGTIRVITNKPNTEGTEASGNIGIGLSSVKGGDAGHDFDATLNIPLIEDKLAVHISAFSAEDGGFIDNVLGDTVVDEYSGAGGLKNNSYEIVDTPADSDVVIVNTCGFLNKAREESIDTILNLGKLKKEGKIKILSLNIIIK